MLFQNQKFNVIRFLSVFTLLTVFFYVYVGIISPGGKIYSSFLKSYADFPAWFTYLICKSAKWFLQILGYSVYQKKANNITISGSRGINIIWACLGLGVMSFWIAFVTAHQATWIFKVKWSFIGIILITCINILRIILIALGFHYRWMTFNAIDIHSSFNIISYIVIFLLALWFVVRYNKNKSSSTINRKQEADNAFSINK